MLWHIFLQSTYRRISLRSSSFPNSSLSIVLTMSLITLFTAFFSIMRRCTVCDGFVISLSQCSSSALSSFFASSLPKMILQVYTSLQAVKILHPYAITPHRLVFPFRIVVMRRRAQRKNHFLPVYMRTTVMLYNMAWQIWINLWKCIPTQKATLTGTGKCTLFIFSFKYHRWQRSVLARI